MENNKQLRDILYDYKLIKLEDGIRVAPEEDYSCYYLVNEYDLDQALEIAKVSTTDYFEFENEIDMTYEEYIEISWTSANIRFCRVCQEREIERVYW